jgi:hypothetical protein
VTSKEPLVGTDTLGTGLPWVEAIAASFPRYPFVEFHTNQLPALNARNKELVVDDLAGVSPIAFRIPGGTAYTWLSTPDGVRAVEGHADAHTLVELDEATFSLYLHDLLTASGSVRTDRATLARGSLTGWKRWEPAIRTLMTGKPIYTEAVWDTLVDRDGAPLDPFRAFPAMATAMRCGISSTPLDTFISKAYTPRRKPRRSALRSRSFAPRRLPATRSRGGRSTLPATKSSLASITWVATQICCNNSVSSLE